MLSWNLLHDSGQAASPARASVSHGLCAILSGWKHSGTGITEFVWFLACLSLRLLPATAGCIMLSRPAERELWYPPSQSEKALGR